MTDHIQDILDRCVDAVIEGNESIDSCCAKYPESAPVLEPLMRVEFQARSALEVEAPGEAKITAREEGLSRARDLFSAKRAAPRRLEMTGRRSFMLRPVAIAAAFMVFLFAGTAVAATMAEPDSALYPLKQQMEEVRTVLAMHKFDKARVENDHANARLDEIATMVAKNKAEYLPDLLERYNSHMDTAMTLIGEIAQENGDTVQLEALLRATQYRHDYLLLGLIDQIPEEVEDPALDALRQSGQVFETGAPGTLPGAGTVPGDPYPQDVWQVDGNEPPPAAGSGMQDGSYPPEGGGYYVPEGSSMPDSSGLPPGGGGYMNGSEGTTGYSGYSGIGM
ncbi:MAG: DUF5667 domain-containing protein [Thermoleophilia bacterium]